MLGDRFGGVGRDVADDDSFFTGSLKVDSIITGRGDADQLQIGTGVHRFTGDGTFVNQNDLRVTDPRSLIRAQNAIIAANVDTVVTSVDMPPVPDAIHTPSAGNGADGIRIEPLAGQKTLSITLAPTGEHATLTLYASDGRLVKSATVSATTATVSLPGLGSGTYVARVSQGKRVHAVKVVLP